MIGRPGDRTMEMIGGSTALYPLASQCFCFLIGVEAKGLLDFQGRRGITSVVRWNPRPVIFGVEFWEFLHRAFQQKPGQIILRTFGGLYIV